MLDQNDTEKSFTLVDNGIKLEYEGSDDESKFTQIEVSVDPNVVLQNSEEPLSPSSVADEPFTTFEDVTHLHAVDSDNVTIKLIKKREKSPNNKEKKEDRGPKPFPCLTCQRSYYSELALKNHYWTHINDEKSNNTQFSCSSCHKGFDNKIDIIEHLKIHKINGVCQICGRG